MTPTELLHALKNLDEVTLLEILDLHSDEIVDKFQQEIEERFEELQYKVEDPRFYEEEVNRREELDGKLSWKTSYKEALDFDDYDE